MACSYNVLANAYIRAEYYPGVPAELFEPEPRRAALLDRIAGLGAQVLCLQEVEPDLYAALLERLPGMRGLYLQKGRGKPDGCATFVSRELALRAQDALHFDDGTGHVALLCAVGLGDWRLWVANTHLRWDAPSVPPSEAAGLRQALRLLEYLGDRTSSAILCGDFNAEPGSPALQAALRGGFSDPHEGLGLSTFYSREGSRRLDYLLHGPQLRCVPHAGTAVAQGTSLPAAGEPSDHVPLLASFDWVGE